MKGFAVIKPPVPDLVRTDEVPRVDHSTAENTRAHHNAKLLEDLATLIDALPPDQYTWEVKYETWRTIKHLIQKLNFDITVLTQLVRDAADKFTNRDTQVDVEHWLEMAKPVLEK